MGGGDGEGDSQKGRGISPKGMSHTLLFDMKKKNLKKAPLISKLAMYVSQKDTLILLVMFHNTVFNLGLERGKEKKTQY